MKKRTPAEVFPPSVYILDELAARGWDRDDIVRRSHLSRMHLDDILDQYEPITEFVAEQLATAFGTSAIIWMRLDATFRPRYEQFVVDLEAAVRADPTLTISEDGLISDATPPRYLVKRVKSWL